jgi:hypothetical protein
MHFVLKRKIVVAIFQLALIPLASCATTHGAPLQAANRLEQQADTFASDVRREASLNQGMSAYAQHAQDFAEQAHDFSHAVATAAGDHDVVYAFHSLWRSYHTLSDDVRSAQDRADFKPAMAAFAEVKQDVTNRYAGSDGSLLTSGGYQYDPYYK